MSKICVLGNSQMGAIRRADGEIARLFPGLEVSYFGAPGGLFHSCTVDKHGNFGPRLENQREKDVINTVNGRESQNLNDFDAILVIGHRFDFSMILHLLLEHDILGLSATDRPRLCSAEFFNACCDGVIRNFIASIKTQVGQGHNIIITPAPYPAKSIIEPGKGHRRVNAHLASHPEGAALFDFFMSKVEVAMAEAGYGFFQQPPSTVAGPFLTHVKYTKGVKHFLDDTKELSDHTHMNAEYGLAVFQEFAHNHLSQTAAQAPAAAL